MSILDNMTKAHELLDDCNAQNGSGGCLFCSGVGYEPVFGLKHDLDCLIIKLRRLIEVEKALDSVLGG